MLTETLSGEAQNQGWNKMTRKNKYACNTEEVQSIFIWFVTKGAFVWGDLDQDQWSKITQIMVQQRNQWTISAQGNKRRKAWNLWKRWEALNGQQTSILNGPVGKWDYSSEVPFLARSSFYIPTGILGLLFNRKQPKSHSASKEYLKLGWKSFQWRTPRLSGASARTFESRFCESDTTHII